MVAQVQAAHELEAKSRFPVRRDAGDHGKISIPEFQMRVQRRKTRLEHFHFVHWRVGVQIFKPRDGTWLRSVNGFTHSGRPVLYEYVVQVFASGWIVKEVTPRYTEAA